MWSSFFLRLPHYLAFFLLIPFQAYTFSGRVNSDSAPFAWPSMAAILLWDRTMSYYKLICGGVVWNEISILTAANCVVQGNVSVRPKRLNVYVGNANISDLKLDHLLTVAHVVPDPRFNQTTHLFDFAVLQLRQPLDFAGIHADVRCTCQPQEKHTVDYTRCVGLGWGRTSTGAGSLANTSWLQKVPLHVQREDICHNMAAYSKGENYFDWHVMKCASHDQWFVEDSNAACEGDFGGPVLCPSRRQPLVFTLVGLLSKNIGFPEKCSSAQKGMTVFTDIDTYSCRDCNPWFRNVTREEEFENVPLASQPGTSLLTAGLVLLLLIGMALLFAFMVIKMLEKKAEPLKEDASKMVTPTSTSKQGDDKST